MVGATSAYALLLTNCSAQVLLVDKFEKAAIGQALDVADASLTLPGNCSKGTFKEAGQSDVVVITAGLPQAAGQSREDLLKANADVMREICLEMQPMRKDLKILVVTNPVDTLTHVVQKFSGLPRNQVFGSGTHLDSCRLRGHLSHLLKVHPSSIHASVLGEHGDRQFVAWSQATVGLQPILSHPKMKDINRDEIMEAVMKKAYTIIDAKRSTYFGIGMCVAQIVRAILGNSYEVLNLTHYSQKEDLYFSWPCSIGHNGIDQSFDTELDSEEKKRFNVALAAIKSMRDIVDAKHD